MRDRRTVAIWGLSALVVLLAALLVHERWSLAGPGRPGPDAEPVSVIDWLRERWPPWGSDQRGTGAPVSVVDVALDREKLRHLDLHFDRPLGEERVGGVLAEEPARIEPRVGGIWRWQGANVLRFSPSRRFAAATAYEVELRPERLVGEGQRLVGETRFRVVTDQFQVDRLEVFEELRPEGKGRVELRGTLHFNYPVDPKELAPRLELLDGAQKVPLGIETGYHSKDIAWRSEVVAKSTLARELQLRVGSDLTPARGNVALGVDFVETIPLGSSQTLVVREVVATPGEEESTLRVELTSPVPPERARDHLRVEPEVEFALSRSRNALLLRGPFQPGQSYQVHIRAGLRAEDDSTLPEDVTKTVDLANLPPRVEFQSAGMFLAARGQRNLALETVNAPGLDLRVERVYRNNVLYLLEQRGYLLWRWRSGHGRVDRIYGDRIAKASLKVEGPPNRTITTPLHLDDWLGDEEPGLYRVVVGREKQRHESAQRWLLITDLGIVAKQGRDELLVWVSSFSDVSPVAGVRVQVRSDQNQPLAEGTTDAQGLVHLRGLGDGSGDARPALVTAEKGDDWSFVPLQHARIDTAGLDVAGAAEGASGYDAFLYGERQLYRPGETLEGAAVLRDTELSVPPAMPLLLRHRDPQGQPRRETRLELGDGGIAEFTHDIPLYALTGRHSLELLVGEDVVGRYGFQVEEFVPDRIKVEIEPVGAAALAGRPLEYDVASAYLFGPPAAGLAVESRVHLEAVDFRPTGFEAFSFRNGERKLKRREILEQQAQLDAEGRIRLSAPIPEDLSVPSSLRAVISARVRERGGRGVAARGELPVHPYPYYLGLRLERDRYAEPGEATPLEFVAVTPGGEELPSGALRAELFYDRWQTVLRLTSSGTYRYESSRDPQLVSTQLLEGGRSRGSFEVTPLEFGSYRVVLTDEATGASTQVHLYASGWGFAPWAIENPGRIELDLERTDYRVGERAVLQVRAPFPGRLLLTVERSGVLHREVHTLEGNTARLELPVLEAYRPNVYVTATLVRPASALEPGSVGRAFGALPLYVDRERHRMPVSLDAPREIRPSGPLQVEARAAPGSYLTLAAVDEGILQLIAQKTPDPFAHFYRKRALGVQSFDIFALLLPEVAPLEGTAPAGGGRALAQKRQQLVRTDGIRRVKPVAFWSGVVRADAAGVARASFDVPEFQGALRLMAVAHGVRSFGGAERQVRVRDPLVLLPTFPRFLSFGERLELPVTLRNDTGRAGSFRVALAARGPATVEGESERSVELDDAAERTLYFTLATAMAPGALELSLEASGNAETTRASTSLGLRADLPAVTHELAGQVDEASFAPPTDVLASLRPEDRTLELRIGPVPLLQLYGKLAYLVRYPYGCLEQVVSRAFPLIYVGELAARLEPALFDEHDPDALVAEAIRRVATLRHPGGGFTLWPNGRGADLWASIYTTHFLVEAQRAGHEVPRGLLEKALEFVAGEARSKPRYSSGALERAAYALFVLARAGRADRASMDFLREKQLNALRPASRAQLGAAYASAGDRAAVDVLLQGLEAAETVRRQTGGNFASTTRNRALVLLALLDAAPDDARIPRLADRLARDALSNRYWTTQETSFALLALGQLFERQADRAPYSGRVLVDGEEVGRFGSETTLLRDLPAGKLEVSMDPGYEPGAAFWSLSVRGVPTDEAFAPAAEGIEVERRLLTRERGAIGEQGVQQGDLLILQVRVKSQAGRLENLAIQQLLPAGLEIENPRLATSEALPWTNSDLPVDHVDVRDDRLLVFAGLDRPKGRTYYALLRAVAPGRFRLPPLQVEAMYDPAIRFTGERGELEVRVRQ